MDALLLNLSDILGKKQTGNSELRSGIDPYIWDDCGESGLVCHHPNSQDYQQLTGAVADYLEVFQEQAQTADCPSGSRPCN